MTKLIIGLVLLALTMALAERPSWYPENAAELEVKCMKEHAVSPETVANMRAFNLDEAPAIVAVLFCSGKAKKIYTPELGFVPERFAYAMKTNVKMDCNVDYIRNCAEQHKDVQPVDTMYFKVVKCVFDNREGHCTKV
ncbi:uncharacterized protein LOC106080594 [Stomoxys calcitrans]|uniref:Uncharacterized protein n=1 Tax=Stomoxys calcitrans TaxID=35570 RepID=A0A2Y9D4N4_STOCA|nr:uncharacterized protein LOC106080594 [Stomoxys calcitrans]